MNIYSCRGRHFKVYNDSIRRVLEHPSDTEEVDLAFRLTPSHLEIIVTGFVETDMRISGQKKRIDIYILQEQFQPILDILDERVGAMTLQHAPRALWKYGAPTARDGRQGVPALTKLTELGGVNAIAHFQTQVETVRNATAIFDSEVPGHQQTKWIREGGSRQIHIGIFGGAWSFAPRVVGTPVGAVMVTIPLNQIRNNFLAPIRTNWVQ